MSDNKHSDLQSLLKGGFLSEQEESAAVKKESHKEESKEKSVKKSESGEELEDELTNPFLNTSNRPAQVVQKEKVPRIELEQVGNNNILVLEDKNSESKPSSLVPSSALGSQISSNKVLSEQITSRSFAGQKIS